MKKLFSFEGRARRSEFFIHSIIDDLIIIAFIGIAVALAVAIGESAAALIVILVLLCVVVFVAGMISEIAVTVRRLHDLNRPGSHFWLSLIPFVNMYLGFILLFSRGTEGLNRYGDDPKGPKIHPDTPPASDPLVRDMQETVREIP